MKVGVCAIIKDCPSHYLKEWVEWHTLIGVDYFFIYDNDSEIPISNVLKKYEHVDVRTISGKPQQLNAYNNCILRHNKGEIPKCDWIAFIDDDEFIVIEHTGRLKDFLKPIEASGIMLNWCLFGAEEQNKSKSQIDRYTKCTPITHPRCLISKTIVRPETVNYFKNPHYAVYHKGHAVDVLDRKPSHLSSHTTSSTRRIAWVNHYYCKTKDEFQAKIKKGRVSTARGQYNMSHFNAVNPFATETNTEIQKLKKRFANTLQGTVALITPTGGRQKQIELCVQWMKNQTYLGKVLWVLVDDCEPTTTDFIPYDFRENWTVVKHRPKPTWKTGDNTQKRNIREAIEVIEKYENIEYVFIIEDDDYYAPEYIETMLEQLKGYEAAGQIKTKHYHTLFNTIYAHSNTKHVSLFKTALNVSQLPVLKEIVTDVSDLEYIDIHFWEKMAGKKVNLFESEKCIALGIKGMNGRKGITSHKNRVRVTNNNKLQRLLQLKQLIGMDYLKYIHE